MSPLGELQLELLQNLMVCNSRLTIKNALSNLYGLNRRVAWVRTKETTCHLNH
jgi:hypothetical protein